MYFEVNHTSHGAIGLSLAAAGNGCPGVERGRLEQPEADDVDMTAPVLLNERSFEPTGGQVLYAPWSLPKGTMRFTLQATTPKALMPTWGMMPDSLCFCACQLGGTFARIAE